MENLNTTRLWLTAKWDATTNWKSSVRIMAGMTFGLLILYTVHFLNMLNVMYSPDYITSQYRSMAIETNISFIVFMVAGASLIFANMRTKQQRIAFCMLPASNAEKYIVRWLWATVGFALIFICASVAADLIRIVIWWIAGYGYTGSVVATGTGILYESVCNVLANCGTAHTGDSIHALKQKENYAIMTYCISFCVMAHSFYILGGTLFRRNAWLLTTLTAIVLAIILLHTGNFPFIDGTLFGRRCSIEQKIMALYILSGIFAMLSVVFYIVSWKLFRRMQVINDITINL